MIKSLQNNRNKTRDHGKGGNRISDKGVREKKQEKKNKVVLITHSSSVRITESKPFLGYQGIFSSQ
jgi:hypothetical protein